MAGKTGSVDCARIVLAHCLPAAHARMAGAMERTGASLMALLPGILQVWTDAARNPRVWTLDA